MIQLIMVKDKHVNDDPNKILNKSFLNNFDIVCLIIPLYTRVSILIVCKLNSITVLFIVNV